MYVQWVLGTIFKSKKWETSSPISAVWMVSVPHVLSEDLECLNIQREAPIIAGLNKGFLLIFPSTNPVIHKTWMFENDKMLCPANGLEMAWMTTARFAPAQTWKRPICHLLSPSLFQRTLFPNSSGVWPCRLQHVRASMVDFPERCSKRVTWKLTGDRQSTNSLVFSNMYFQPEDDGSQLTCAYFWE